MLAFYAPTFVGLAVVIKCLGHGKVLDRDTMLGLDGKPFGRWRFATPGRDDTLIHRLVSKSGVGALPAAFNVIAGEMSLVGPRARAWAPGFPNALSDADRRRLSTRPGMAGVGTPDGRSAQQAELDYLTDWNLGRDLHILRQVVLQAFVEPVRGPT